MTTDTLIPLTAAQFVTAAFGTAAAAAMYGMAYYFAGLYRKARAGGGSISLGRRWLAAGCSVFAVLGSLLVLVIAINASLAVAAGAFQDDWFIGMPLTLGSILCGASVVFGRIVEDHETARSRVLWSAIPGALAVLLFVCGVMIAFDSWSSVDWCTVFICAKETGA